MKPPCVGHFLSVVSDDHVSSLQANALAELAAAHGVALSVVGAFEKGEGLWLQDASVRAPLPPRAHQHFSPRAGA